MLMYASTKVARKAGTDPNRIWNVDQPTIKQISQAICDLYIRQRFWKREVGHRSGTNHEKTQSTLK